MDATAQARAVETNTAAAHAAAARAQVIRDLAGGFLGWSTQYLEATGLTSADLDAAARVLCVNAAYEDSRATYWQTRADAFARGEEPPSEGTDSGRRSGRRP